MVNSRERLLAALDRKTPDRLPVTTHHLMPYFLERHLNGIGKREFFDRFGLDAVCWVVAHRPKEAARDRCDPLQGPLGFLDARRIVSDSSHILPMRFRTSSTQRPAFAS